MRRVVLDRMTPVVVVMVMVMMMVVHHRRRSRVGRCRGRSSGSSGGWRGGVVGKSDHWGKHERRREADRRKNFQHLVSPCEA